jgi:4-hydroxybenzoate polyprenyltransferase
MTLTTIASGIGLYFIKVIIENNRIPIEWIMLYAFTVGFLLTTSLTISEWISDPDYQKTKENLFQFNIILMVVLLIRAGLDYLIGEGIYFPETSKAKETS